MKGFYHIWAWRPSWSCDLDFLYTHLFPLPIDASYKIWLWVGQAVSEKKIFENGGRRTDGRRTTDGRTTEHGYTISSPCEPDGSVELKIGYFSYFSRLWVLVRTASAKFQASSSFLCLFRSVCVGPVRKPHCWFSHEVDHVYGMICFVYNVFFQSRSLANYS